MAITNKLFTFATLEGWAFTPVGDLSGGLGSPALQTDCSGRGDAGVDGYWEWTGTWEDLGVTVGDEISQVNLDFDWSCSSFLEGVDYDTGAAQIYASNGTTLIGTFSTKTNGSGTTSFATRTGSAVSIGSSYHSSSTIIKLRIYVSEECARQKTTLVSLLYDNISIDMTHITPEPSTRRVFIIS
jgi:hypothetical protein